ncbi:tyrosine--tRNA ligase [candidate division TM6 bacterium RIFCSPHIGHO2_12_FULL_36_22]|nr:MAG: tyrosine--tRNA ligase [candidate division TM6 bacterium RIFCSPHIGHO2_12_FULL_36_22]
MVRDIKKDLSQLLHGTAQVLPADALEKKLATGKPLKVKLGMDPTAPDLHLGHAVVLQKLKNFQDQGHEVIFLIGDFTASIGDPTGRSKTRPPLTSEQIAENITTYFEQVGHILDPEKVSVRYNSEWLAKLSMSDLVALASKITVAQLIERDDFSKRLAEKLPISFHELLYPIFQGYDSVALQADVELGGTDQTFNMLVGRHLQEHYGQNPQVVISMPLLEGLDGVQKMSKSLGNAIGFTDTPEDAYGKLMSVSDILMWRYYLLLLGYSQTDIDKLKVGIEKGTIHPMDLKKRMAHEIVAKFWSDVAAKRAQETFEALFQKKDLSAGQEIELPSGTENPLWIVELLKLLGAIKSSSEARRLIESGAVQIDDTVIQDFKAEINWKPDMCIKVGKHRIYRLV